NEGAKASNEGDYAKAVRLLKVSLDLGATNVTYLNLGRALQKAGECEEARHAYDKALLAPPVENPSPDKVRAIAFKYQQELNARCSGMLIVTCAPETTQLRIDGGKPMACDSAPLALSPGKHVLEGESGGKRTSREVIVRAFQETHVRLFVHQPVLADAREQFRVAQGLIRDGQLERGRTRLLEAHQTAPHWGPPMLELGQIALRKERYVEAIKWLERYRPYAQPNDLPKLDRLVTRAEQQLDAMLRTRRPIAQSETPKPNPDKVSSDK
ncbi:MAG: hypothetical protein AAFS10_19720, partial [Myxococcota bacterium]